jgi:DNA-binding IclR family transcriptional regulator
VNEAVARAGSSPPTARVVRVIEHLASRPDRPRNATDIARELGIARATCALILEELASTGWLAHIPGKGYVLGPRLVPIGQSALTSPASGSLAHDALVALSDDLGLVCTTSGVVGDRIFVLDRAGPHTTQGLDVHVGMQFPFAPPLGIVNLAWQPDSVVEDWLRTSPRPLSDEDRKRLWEAVADARASGVYIEQLTPHIFPLWSLLAGMARDDVPAALQRAIGDALVPLAGRGYHSRDLVPGRSYPVSIAVAPTFDGRGRQHLALAAFVADDAVPYKRLMRIAERVRAAADSVTREAGGFDPWTKA